MEDLQCCKSVEELYKKGQSLQRDSKTFCTVKERK